MVGFCLIETNHYHHFVGLQTFHWRLQDYDLRPQAFHWDTDFRWRCKSGSLQWKSGSLQWKFWSLQWKSGSLQRKSVRLRENLWSPMKLFGSPMKVWESATKIWGLSEKLGVSNDNLGVQWKFGTLQEMVVMFSGRDRPFPFLCSVSRAKKFLRYTGSPT